MGRAVPMRSTKQLNFIDEGADDSEEEEIHYDPIVIILDPARQPVNI
jgi:hypothetical protein